MYLIDFFKRMARKSNIPVIIYLILNVIIIGGIVQMFYGEGSGWQFWQSFLVGLALYVVSLAVALSPFGEWLLRLQTGCKKITNVEQLNYLNPIFREVYAKAKQADPTIPDDVQLFINRDQSPNAFATGRKTVCVTEGLLRMPTDQIKATLGHEFGHLAHKDTDLILVITIGNFIITAIITIIRVIIIFVDIILSIFADDWAGALTSFISLLFIDLFMWVWTKVGTLLVMKSSRSNEYEADEFSFNLGYGKGLCGLLSVIGDSGTKGLFATLASSHPESSDRIARLQALEANRSAYNDAYGNNAYQQSPKQVVQQESNVYANNGIVTPAPVMAAGLSGNTTNNMPSYGNDNLSQNGNNAFGGSFGGSYGGSFGNAYQDTTKPTMMGGFTSNDLRCSSCNTVLSPGTKFCHKCGAKVMTQTVEKPSVIFCPNCGTKNEGDALFCFSCGSKLQ